MSESPALSTRPLIGLASAPWQLLAMRVADRLGKGVRAAPRDALIAESTSKDQLGRAFGYHRSMDHLDAAIGPLLASLFLWWQPTGIRWLFALTLIPGIAVLLTLIFGVRGAADDSPPQSSANESNGSNGSKESKESIARSAPSSSPQSPPSSVQGPQSGSGGALRGVVASPGMAAPVALSAFHWGQLDGSFRLFLVSLLVFTLGNSSDAFLLVRARDVGVAEVYLPLLWLVFHLVKSAGNWLSGFAADRWEPRRMVLAGWIVYAATYLGFAVSRTASQLVALMLVYGVFYALTEPAEKLLVTRWAKRIEPGLAFGWFHLTIGIASLPASLICGALYEALGPLAALGFGAAMAFLASLLLLAVRDRPILAAGNGK